MALPEMTRFNSQFAPEICLTIKLSNKSRVKIVIQGYGVMGGEQKFAEIC